MALGFWKPKTQEARNRAPRTTELQGKPREATSEATPGPCEPWPSPPREALHQYPARTVASTGTRSKDNASHNTAASCQRGRVPRPPSSSRHYRSLMNGRRSCGLRASDVVCNLVDDLRYLPLSLPSPPQAPGKVVNEVSAECCTLYPTRRVVLYPRVVW